MKRRHARLWICAAILAFPTFQALPVTAGEVGRRGVEIDGLYDYDGYPPYIRLLEALYLPPQKGGKETVQLKFYVYPHLPPGTRLTLTLEYMGLEYASRDFEFRGGSEEFDVDWTPEKRLAAGEYFVSSRIYPEKQSAEVREALKKDAEHFPLEQAPWQYLYMRDDLAIVVGSGLSSLEEYEEVRRIYEAFVEQLFANFQEFRGKTEAAKTGAEFSTEGKFDGKAFEEYVSEWRKKQAEVQEKIADFPYQNTRLFVESRAAYVRLLFLGRMISKLSRKLEKQVLEAHGVSEISPAVPRGFDYSYRYPVDERVLQAERNVILRILDSLKPETPEPESTEEEKTPGEGE